ncbi:MAG: ABC transporter ATP-binding protein [Dermatophilaceae bacterium]
MRTIGDYPRLRILWTFVHPHRRELVLGFLLGLVGTGIGLATPLAVKWVIDSIGTRAGMSTPVVVLLALLVVGTVVTLVQWVLLGTVAERVVLDARSDLVRRFVGARMPELTGRSTGELVTRVTSDTVLLREAASGAGPGLVNAAIGLVGAFVLMAVLDIVLLGITLALIAVVFVLFARLMPRIATAEAASQEALGKMGAELEGNLRAIRTVKASRAEQRQAARLLAGAHEASRFSLTAVRTSALAWSISWAGVNVAILVILALGAVRVDAGAITVSTLVAFLLYAFQMMGPIQELTQNVTAMQSGLAAAERIGEVRRMSLEQSLDDVRPQRLDWAPAAPGSPQPDDAAPAAPAAVRSAEPSPPSPVLRLRGIRAGYGDGPDVLHGIDLEVPRRGHVAVVGPSGAGKTTLFSLLMRFLDPREGTIELDGRPYPQWSVADVRARFAYVEQDTPLVPGTVEENVRFREPGAGRDEVTAALAAVQLDAMVAGLPEGLATPVTGDVVSGGQRQRLAIARAVLRLPEVLLLDEATAQVDGLTEAAVQRSIAEASRHGAVVTIAHRLSTVLEADEIVVLEAGRVRARGTHEELLTSDDLYRRLVEALRIAAVPGESVLPRV